MWALIIIIPLVDFLIKNYINNNFTCCTEMSTFLPCLTLVKVKNFGIAFGIFKGHTWLTVMLTFIFVLFLILSIIKKKIKDKRVIFPVCLIVGGGIGNLIDRVFFGFVIDYLKLSFFTPVCNLSDYCICVGSFLLFIILIRKNKLVF